MEVGWEGVGGLGVEVGLEGVGGLGAEVSLGAVGEAGVEVEGGSLEVAAKVLCPKYSLHHCLRTRFARWRPRRNALAE